MTARRQELTGWALVGPDGNVDALCDLAWVKEGGVRVRLERIPVHDLMLLEDRERDLYRRGYSARPVRVTVEVES